MYGGKGRGQGERKRQRKPLVYLHRLFKRRALAEKEKVQPEMGAQMICKFSLLCYKLQSSVKTGTKRIEQLNVNGYLGRRILILGEGPTGEIAVSGLLTNILYCIQTLSKTSTVEKLQRPRQSHTSSQSSASVSRNFLDLYLVMPSKVWFLYQHQGSRQSAEHLLTFLQENRV